MDDAEEENVKRKRLKLRCKAIKANKNEADHQWA
jgi:hypothetical protein